MLSGESPAEDTDLGVARSMRLGKDFYLSRQGLMEILPGNHTVQGDTVKDWSIKRQQSSCEEYWQLH